MSSTGKPTTDPRPADIIGRARARLYDALAWAAGPRRAEAASSAVRDFGQAHPFLQVSHGPPAVRTQPLLTRPQALAAVWLLLAAVPILVYLGFVLACVAFATGLSALFVAFWAGLALLVFVPALLAATAVALFVWFWGSVAVVGLRAVRGAGPAGPPGKRPPPPTGVYLGYQDGGRDREGGYRGPNGSAWVTPAGGATVAPAVVAPAADTENGLDGTETQPPGPQD